MDTPSPNVRQRRRSRDPANRIIALAGRRIDAPSSPSSTFPLREVDRVREALSEVFESQGAATLVSSAACGADLLALEVARQRGIRRRVVLPFAREEFRRSSVVDRPGEWGVLFDEICDAAQRSRDLVVMGGGGSGDDAYLAANERIVAEALSLAGARGSAGVLAVVVWNGPRQSGFDATEAFRRLAEKSGIPVREVSTMPPRASPA